MSDEAEQVAYMRRLIELEEAGARTTITIGPFGAMVLIGLLQLSTRHPDLDRRTKDMARGVVQQLAPLFTGTPGEEIVRRGGHPEFDK